MFNLDTIDLVVIADEIILGKITTTNSNQSQTINTLSSANVAKTNPPFDASIIPEKFIGKAQETFAKYLSDFDESSGWDFWFDEDNIKGFRKTDDDGLLCVRGVGMIPVSMPTLFRFILDVGKISIANPQIVFAEKVKTFNSNCWARLMKFEKAPFNIVAQRYFREIMHWCVLEDGRLLLHSWTDDIGDYHGPMDPGMIEAFFHYNGMLIESRGDSGVHVTYISKVLIN
jgi:hypothetical protein